MDEKRKYERGMNLAGETAAQVANYLMAGLRVFLREQPAILDGISERIANAMREAAFANERASMSVMEKDGGWSSIIERARAWMDLCAVADEVYPCWLNLPGSGIDAMKLLVRRGCEHLVEGAAKTERGA